MSELYVINHQVVGGDEVTEVERKLGFAERLWASGTFRKALILVLMAAAWQGYAIYRGNPLLLPTLTETIDSGIESFRDGSLPTRAMISLKVLLTGYAIGIALAAALTVFAMSSRIGSDFLETAAAMFNPLPAIALLPLALIWFGLGSASIVFVLVHSVLWAVALNTHSGFMVVSNTLRMVGQNYGLKGLRYIAIGWAFAWRTLIAAELVFGVSSGQGGLGWFIFEKRNTLDIAGVFSGLLTVIVIGLVVENLIFRTIERMTVKKWGLQN